MKLQYGDRKVEVEIEANNDRSKFITAGYFIDGEMEELTDEDLISLQNEYDDVINEMWTGE